MSKRHVVLVVSVFGVVMPGLALWRLMSPNVASGPASQAGRDAPEAPEQSWPSEDLRQAIEGALALSEEDPYIYFRDKLEGTYKGAATDDLVFDADPAILGTMDPSLSEDAWFKLMLQGHVAFGDVRDWLSEDNAGRLLFLLHVVSRLDVKAAAELALELREELLWMKAGVLEVNWRVNYQYECFVSQRIVPFGELPSDLQVMTEEELAACEEDLYFTCFDMLRDQLDQRSRLLVLQFAHGLGPEGEGALHRYISIANSKGMDWMAEIRRPFLNGSSDPASLKRALASALSRTLDDSPEAAFQQHLFENHDRAVADIMSKLAR